MATSQIAYESMAIPKLSAASGQTKVIQEGLLTGTYSQDFAGIIGLNRRNSAKYCSRIANWGRFRL